MYISSVGPETCAYADRQSILLIKHKTDRFTSSTSDTSMPIFIRMTYSGNKQFRIIM